ncbi:hypothetical protein [Paucibacter soli]|uniref:hypothetical protein n=1 Tax=Paucibacter soli TaxID=3133433 RepID=UPI0030992802
MLGIGWFPFALLPLLLPWILLGPWCWALRAGSCWADHRAGALLCAAIAAASVLVPLAALALSALDACLAAFVMAAPSLLLYLLVGLVARLRHWRSAAGK